MGAERVSERQVIDVVMKLRPGVPLAPIFIGLPSLGRVPGRGRITPIARLIVGMIARGLMEYPHFPAHPHSPRRFGSAWIPQDHLALEDHTPSPLTLAAELATRTERVSIETSILILPLELRATRGGRIDGQRDLGRTSRAGCRSRLTTGGVPLPRYSPARSSVTPRGVTGSPARRLRRRDLSITSAVPSISAGSRPSLPDPGAAPELWIGGFAPADRPRMRAYCPIAGLLVRIVLSGGIGNAPSLAYPHPLPPLPRASRDRGQARRSPRLAGPEKPHGAGSAGAAGVSRPGG